jgi:hypothetical protein
MLLNGVAATSAAYLKETASSHPCAKHPLFERLNRADEQPLTPAQASAMLVNYDVHAGLLRRLLLSAAAYMPEPAVGFVLENVRNEYGNGDYTRCHEGQLHDVIDRVCKIGGIESDTVIRNEGLVKCGVRMYMRTVVDFYQPTSEDGKPIKDMRGPAITAGAITATELMAIEEFKAMQIAFRKFQLADHRWFDHVNVECDHGEESLALAEYFIDKNNEREAVEFGFMNTLAANVHLYDGLLDAIKEHGD